MVCAELGIVTIDLTNEWNCFVELSHLTRDKPESDRIITDRIQLAWTAPTYGGRRTAARR
jgi:hypothetical protein